MERVAIVDWDAHPSAGAAVIEGLESEPRRNTPPRSADWRISLG